MFAIFDRRGLYRSSGMSTRAASQGACSAAFHQARRRRRSFMVRTLRDPDGANLDQIQFNWLDGRNELHERIFDVAVSNDRKIDADGRCTTPYRQHRGHPQRYLHEHKE